MTEKRTRKICAENAKTEPRGNSKKKQKMENERMKKINKKSKNMKYVKHVEQISMEASDDTVAVALADPKKVFKQESRSEKTLSSRVRPQKNFRSQFACLP